MSNYTSATSPWSGKLKKGIDVPFPRKKHNGSCSSTLLKKRKAYFVIGFDPGRKTMAPKGRQKPKNFLVPATSDLDAPA